MAKTKVGRAKDFEIVEEIEGEKKTEEEPVKSVLDDAKTYDFVSVEELAQRADEVKNPGVAKARQIINTVTNITCILSMVGMFYWAPSGIILVVSLALKLIVRPKDERRDYFMK